MVKTGEENVMLRKLDAEPLGELASKADVMVMQHQLVVI